MNYILYSIVVKFNYITTLALVVARLPLHKKIKDFLRRYIMIASIALRLKGYVWSRFGLCLCNILKFSYYNNIKNGICYFYYFFV